MVDAQAISIIFAGVGIGLAAIYYMMTLRNQDRTRQTQLFMQIYDRYMDKEFQAIEAEIFNQWVWEDLDDFMTKYGAAADPEAYGKHTQIGVFYEAIGVLVYRNMLDVRLVDDLMSWSILNFWDRLGPIMVEARERFNIPQNYEWVEYLYNRIKSIAEQQHPELKT
jgi:hypothetical protein